MDYYFEKNYDLVVKMSLQSPHLQYMNYFIMMSKKILPPPGCQEFMNYFVATFEKGNPN